MLFSDQLSHPLDFARGRAIYITPKSLDKSLKTYIVLQNRANIQNFLKSTLTLNRHSVCCEALVFVFVSFVGK